MMVMNNSLRATRRSSFHAPGSLITHHSLLLAPVIRKPLILLRLLFVFNFEKLAVV
jgi:hypothetical protein